MYTAKNQYINTSPRCSVMQSGRAFYWRIMHNMVRGIFFGVVFFCCFVEGFSQIPTTVHGLSMGSSTSGNVSVTVGQLFAQQTAENGYEVAAGVEQAQLMIRNLEVELCENESFNGYGFDFPILPPIGLHMDSNYIVAGHPLHYDMRYLLSLTVNPTYDITREITYHGTLPEGIHEGLNDLELRTAKGCDSTVHLYASICPLTVSDFDGNIYSTVVVSNYCWTKTNLKSEHYADGSSIANALIYSSGQYNNVMGNLNTFGRLYTWYSAVGVDEGSSDGPAQDADGHVRGICPTGWHVPNVLELSVLNSNPAFSLRSTELWVNGWQNTNTTDFSQLPAGRLNSQTGRFEELLSNAYLWSSEWQDGNSPFSLQMDYYCDEGRIAQNLAADALSVRCVKN